MGQIASNGQSGAAWFFNKLISENKKAYGELKDILWGESPKPTEAGKARQNSARARLRNDIEMLHESKPKKQAEVDHGTDRVSLSPEAMALLG